MLVFCDPVRFLFYVIPRYNLKIMPANRTYIFGGAVLIVLALLLGIAYFATRGNPKGGSLSQSTTTPQTSSSTTATQGNATTSGYTISQVPISTLASIEPDLDRKPVFAASVPADARVVLAKDIADTSARLKKNPNVSADWYNLAIYFHEADDFTGARLIWQFLTKATPRNPLAYMNLGKLYQFDLHQYGTAESYFKQAIQVDPKSLEAYMNLYQLYQYSYKQNTTLAVDTLNTAGAKFATSSVPYETLGLYYRDKADYADAEAAFNKALSRARTNNDAAAVAEINQEISSLPIEQTRTQQ